MKIMKNFFAGLGHIAAGGSVPAEILDASICDLNRLRAGYCCAIRDVMVQIQGRRIQKCRYVGIFVFLDTDFAD